MITRGVFIDTVCMRYIDTVCMRYNKLTKYKTENRKLNSKYIKLLNYENAASKSTGG